MLIVAHLINLRSHTGLGITVRMSVKAEDGVFDVWSYEFMYSPGGGADPYLASRQHRPRERLSEVWERMWEAGTRRSPLTKAQLPELREAQKAAELVAVQTYELLRDGATSVPKLLLVAAENRVKLAVEDFRYARKYYSGEEADSDLAFRGQRVSKEYDALDKAQELEGVCRYFEQMAGRIKG